MKAIIVAGGRGERLMPITNEIPKPMVEIEGKPILEHIINLFKNYGIKEYVFALCYLPEVITNYFGDGSKFGVHIDYIYEDPQQPLGTAGAIIKAKNFVKDDFIVTYADILRNLNIKEMISFHSKMNNLATINVYKEFQKYPRSMVNIKDNIVTEFIENPNFQNNDSSFVWTNSSFYIFKMDIFNYINSDTKVDFGKDVFPKLIKSGENISVFKSDGYIIDVGTKESLDYVRNNFSKLEELWQARLP